MKWLDRWRRRETIIKVDLGPDDILVLQVPESLSDETAKRLKEHLQNIVAKDNVLVLSGGMTYSVIRRGQWWKAAK